MDKFENEALGISIAIEPELKHRHIEAYFDEVRLADITKHSQFYAERVFIESAIKAKIVLTPMDVLEQKPAVVAWLADSIVTYIREAREIPKN